jgi:Putative metal-binding motif
MRVKLLPCLLVSTVVLACRGGGGGGGPMLDTGGGDSGAPDACAELQAAGDDSDGDCVGSADDCDDNDAAVYPGAAEVCGNMFDDNCDGSAAPCGFGPGEVDLGTVAKAVLVNDFDGWVSGCHELADLNGDGQLDAAIGNLWGQGIQGGDGGSMHVVFGPVDGERNLQTADVILRGDGLNGEGRFGEECPLEDVDGDGLADLVVVDSFRGFDGSNHKYWEFQSQVYVWFSPLSKDFADESVRSADVVISTPTRSEAIGMVHVGELTGDGVPDLVLRNWFYPQTHSATLIFSGPFDDRDLDTTSAASKILGQDGLSSLSVQAVFDLTGDGIDDVIGENDCEGVAVLVLPGPIPAGTVDPTGLPAWRSGDPGESSCGDGVGNLAVRADHRPIDVDGDGLNDLNLKDSQSQDNDGVEMGTAYLLLGPATGGGDVLTDAYARVDGDYSGGFGVQEALWDFDGDDHVDWLLGQDPGTAFPDRRQLSVLAGPIGPGVHDLAAAASTWLPGDAYPNVGWDPPVLDRDGVGQATIQGVNATHDVTAFSWFDFTTSQGG